MLLDFRPHAFVCIAVSTLSVSKTDKKYFLIIDSSLYFSSLSAVPVLILK